MSPGQGNGVDIHRWFCDYDECHIMRHGAVGKRDVWCKASNQLGCASLTSRA